MRKYIPIQKKTVLWNLAGSFWYILTGANDNSIHTVQGLRSNEQILRLNSGEKSLHELLHVLEFLTKIHKLNGVNHFMQTGRQSEQLIWFHSEQLRVVQSLLRINAICNKKAFSCSLVNKPKSTKRLLSKHDCERLKMTIWRKQKWQFLIFHPPPVTSRTQAINIFNVPATFDFDYTLPSIWCELASESH